MVGLTVCGSFGFGNAGDEAIPGALVDMGRHLGIEVQPHVVGRYEEPAMREVIGLGARDSLRRESLRGQPLIMSGGGIIENVPRAAIFRCEALLKATFSPRACLLGIAAEPGVSYDRSCRSRIERLLGRFQTVYTRDVLSEATINDLFPRVKTETTGDLVLWLQPGESAGPDEACLPDRFVAVVLAPRWSQDPAWHSWISNELHSLSMELGAALVFVPMTGKYDDDRPEHRAVAERLAMLAPKVEWHLIESQLSPRGVANILGRAALVVSMRLHGCVMAYAQKTPFVGLAYHPKLSGFFRTVGWEAALLPSEVPERQYDRVYGFRFSDLALARGQLVRKATECLAHSDFSRLAVLKQRSADVFREFLACA